MAGGSLLSGEADLALFIELVDVVAEADGALTVRPGGDVSGVNRHLRCEIDVQALQRSESLIDTRLIPVAIVAQEPCHELVDAIDANASGGVESSVFTE